MPGWRSTRDRSRAGRARQHRAAAPADRGAHSRGERPRVMAGMVRIVDGAATRDARDLAGEHVGGELHVVEDPDVEHVVVREVHVHAVHRGAVGVARVEGDHGRVGLAVADPGVVVPPVEVAGEARGRETRVRAHVVVEADQLRRRAASVELEDVGLRRLELVVQPDAVEDRVLPVERRVVQHRRGDAAAHMVRAHAGDVLGHFPPPVGLGHAPGRPLLGELLGHVELGGHRQAVAPGQRCLVDVRVPVDVADGGPRGHRDLLSGGAPPRHGSAGLAGIVRLLEVGARGERQGEHRQHREERQPSHVCLPL